MYKAAKHIIFLCSRLDEPGGTERANLNAAHLFIEKGHKVTLVILDVTANSFYPIDKKISVLQKNLSFGINQKGNMVTKKLEFFADIFSLRRLMHQLQPDIIIATDYPYAIAAIIGRCQKWTRVFCWEHHHYHWLQKSKFWNRLIRLTYPKLKAVICYNADETEYYTAFGCRTIVIPNFISNVLPSISEQTQKLILTVGWLNWRKGVDLIPDMARKVFEKFPDWKWKIIGTGEREKNLQSQIKKYNLQDHLFIEEPKNPLEPKDYQKAAMLVMTSRIEPFGLVLIEAMSNRVPCIAFDCRTGPHHIITNNIDGILVPVEDTEKMTKAIEDLITNEGKRKKMGVTAAQNVMRFSAENTFRLWEEVLNAK